jgi:hypothetical protein
MVADRITKQAHKPCQCGPGVPADAEFLPRALLLQRGSSDQGYPEKAPNHMTNQGHSVSTWHGRLRARRGDDADLTKCIEKVVHQLEAISTTGDQPGMLLGKIQSGKTRAFVGVIARAFDHGFNVAVVLTKGTKTLSAQTVARLGKDFEEFIDDDELLVLDIMKLPGKLTRNELRRKIVVVAKKQAQNLDRLIEFIEENAPLKNGKLLLVDDEADLASVRFVQQKGQAAVEQGKIAERMDDLRRTVRKIAFLQVTATPYSLYLQPEGYETPGANYVFKPKKPAFTEILPIHNGYVGGDDYFGSFDQEDPRSALHVEVATQEQDALRRPDQRRINSKNVLHSPNAAGLRRAIMTFIVGVDVRRWEQEIAGARKRKYAMVIHNDTQRAAHAWQEQVIGWIFEAIHEAATKSPPLLRPLFDEAFDDLTRSVTANGGTMPDRDASFARCVEAVAADDVVRERVNSDRDVMALLDQNAELRLRTPYNIFVGGNILDRGITIPNLIAFYYGRNPATMQADTVLQHSRMYGNRDRDDLAVTRFYTSRAVYNRLQTINTFENTLREAFESGAHDRGVVFIQTDPSNRVRPCAPNKIKMSNVVAVRPNGMLLPTNFITRGGQAAQREIDRLLAPALTNEGQVVEVELDVVGRILDKIEMTMEFQGDEFDWNAMHALLEYYSGRNNPTSETVLLLTITGRALSKEKSGDRTGLSILGTAATRAQVLDTRRTKPLLVLLQQSGTKDLGWSGYKFWWPILAAPPQAEPCIFASKTAA